MIVAKYNDGEEFSPSSSQFFLVRIDHHKADEAMEYLRQSEFDIRDLDFFWLSRLISGNDLSHEDRCEIIMVAANIWPSMDKLDRKLWRFIVSIPGFMDFGKGFLTTFPKLLDMETVDTLCSFLKSTCQFQEKKEKVQIEQLKVGDVVEILFGKFTNCVGKVAFVQGQDVRMTCNVVVNLMGKDILLSDLTPDQVKKVGKSEEKTEK